MTWILPKNLPTSASALVTQGLILDLNEQSRIFGQSLLVRSKPSPAPIWLRKWKRDTWTQHLSGRICEPSRSQTFTVAWTSFLGGSHASHSATRERDLATKTQGTSSQPFCEESGQLSLPWFSLRTWKESSPPSSLETAGRTPPEPQFCSMSSGSWNEWVTGQRREFSQRLKSAPHTSASGSSSWPTAKARDWKDTGSTQGNRKTPDLGVAVNFGPAAPARSSSHGSRPESWQTPEAKNQVGYHNQKDGTKVLKLGSQVQAWATPQTRDHRSGDPARFTNPERSKNLNDQMPLKNGKLNARWVETLMGLPIGWTMPSCTSPVTPGLMNCDCSATASSPQPQN